MKSLVVAALLTAAGAVAQTPAPPAVEPSLVCSIGAIQVCTPGKGCEAKTTAELNVPPLVLLDFGAKKIRALGLHEGRESRMTLVDQAEERLVISGYENKRAFSAVIDADGILVLSASTDATGFVAFGNCASAASVKP